MAKIGDDYRRCRYTKLELRELSSVTDPAQPGALVAIMKRCDDPPGFDAKAIAEVAKYVCEGDGAHSFSEVLRENKFSQEIWPCVDALSQSIRSIVGDSSIGGSERDTKIKTSVDEFLGAVAAIDPTVAKQLTGTIRKEDTMAKSIEELTREVEKLTGELTSQTSLATAEKARADKAEDELAAAIVERDAAKTEGGELAKVQAELATTKAALVAATDETIKVEETEVRKSVVGDAHFAVTKALVSKAHKSDVEKRVATDFAHVPGTNAEKAEALIYIEKLDAENPARKAAETVFKAAEKMARAGFDTLGRGGLLTDDARKAKENFDSKVDEIQQRDKISHSEAMTKARTEHPSLFEAYQGESGGEAEAQ